MAGKPKTVADLISRWPSVEAFGDDAGSQTVEGKPVKPNHVHTMKVRRNIPSDYWLGLIAGAKRRGIPGITAEVLLEIQQHEQATA